MKSVKIAVPTKGDRGTRDVVSDVFARAPTFTIIEVVDGEVRNVAVEENPAANLKQGAGPVVAKMLKEKGVNVVASGEMGPGATTLLEMSGIRMVQVDPGVKVKDVLEKVKEDLLQLA
jgi:predicted Fe-Mo cluster-binding NifX family protein